MGSKKVAQDMFAILKEYLNSGDSVSVLVAGKTGVGKSSLVNSLIGNAQLAKEGSSVRPVSSEIISYTTSLNTPIPGKENEVTLLTAWDSPGFGDIFISKMNRKERLCTLKLTIEKADLLLYCFKITDRITTDDITGIVEITKALDPSIWRKAVFPLTFANNLEIPESEKGNKGAKSLAEYLSYKVQEWKTIIRGVLKDEAGVPEDILKDISVVPVGYRDKNPPGQDDWYTSFWIELYEKTRETGKPGLVRLTWSRFDCQEDKIPEMINDRILSDSLPVNLFNSSSTCTNLINVGNLEQHLPSLPQPSASDTHVFASTQSPDTVNESTKVHRTPSPPIQPASHISQEVSLNIDHPRERGELPVGNAPPHGNGEKELRTTGRVETSVPPVEPQSPDNQVQQPQLMKAARIGGIIGSSAATGAIIGLLIGIVGGPIGLAIGAGAGLALGGGIGAGGLIAQQLAMFIKKKREEKKQTSQLQPDNVNIN